MQELEEFCVQCHKDKLDGLQGALSFYEPLYSIVKQRKDHLHHNGGQCLSIYLFTD